MAIDDTFHPAATRDDVDPNEPIVAKTFSEKGKASIDKNASPSPDMSKVQTFSQKGRALFSQLDPFAKVGASNLELSPDKQYFLNTIGPMSRNTPLTKVINIFIRVCEKMRTLGGASRDSTTGKIQESVLEEGVKPLPKQHRGMSLPTVSGRGYTDDEGVSWVDVIKNFTAEKAALEAERDPANASKYWTILRQAAALHDAIASIRGRSIPIADGNVYQWREKEDSLARKQRISVEKRKAVSSAREYIKNTGVEVEVTQDSDGVHVKVPDSIKGDANIEAFKRAAIEAFNRTPQRRIVITPLDLKPPVGYRAAIRKKAPLFAGSDGDIYTQVEFRQKNQRQKKAKAPPVPPVTPPPDNPDTPSPLPIPPKIPSPTAPPSVEPPGVSGEDEVEPFPIEVVEHHGCIPFRANGTVADADCFIKIMQSRVVEAARTGRGVSPYVIAADYLQYDSGEQVAKSDPKPGQFNRYSRYYSGISEAVDKPPAPVIRMPGQSYRGEVIGTHRSQEREGIMQATEQQTNNVHSAIVKAFVKPGYLVYMTPEAYQRSKKSILGKIFKPGAWKAGV